MMRDRLLWILAALALLAGGWWLSVNTEWVDQDKPRPARGQARDNPIYAFEQLLRQLGMTVRQVKNMDALPPEGARLLLLSQDWEILPRRAEALRAWVRRGGHLVLLQGAEWDETSLEKWVPVYAVDVRPPAAASAPASASAAQSSAKRLNHLSATPPLWDGLATLDHCGSLPATQRLILKPGARALLTLEGPQGARGLRVAEGQGTVTVLALPVTAVHNHPALACDNPLLLAAALQAAPGAAAWIYLDESRQALVPWLWHEGRIAVLTLALALAAVLWRGAIRFGPRMAPAPRLRRSIAEQVRGLGAWLKREGRDSLLAAQQRALDETAARRLPGYRRLAPAARAGAIAAATRLPAEALRIALQMRSCTRAQLPAYLHTLEAARRALLLHPSDDSRPTPP